MKPQRIIPIMAYIGFILAALSVGVALVSVARHEYGSAIVNFLSACFNVWAGRENLIVAACIREADQMLDGGPHA